MYSIFVFLLQKHNVTSYKVGKSIGIGSSTFTNWKNGKSIPKQDKLKRIADYFGVTIEYLMGKEGEIKKENFKGEIEEMIQLLKLNKDMYNLLYASKNLGQSDIKILIAIAKKLSVGQ